ncbi:hypothetical protein DPMN_081999 [Dreissena polymorpha]|uniref:Reverse transcriptase domain-containing protein n=1 Tax=Dreissena polymorpha TaxID=45954 RepID=A0A9D3Y9Z9_DREPO|nr:hypothetical protein DPMN_081999 [Dreissena polymorpha]
METRSFIRNSIKPLHWGVSLDLEDAYFHVPIHPTSGSTFDSPFMTKSTSSGPCHLVWRPPHEFLPN